VLAFSPEGKALAAAAGDLNRPGEIKVWDVATGHPTASCQRVFGNATGLQFTPDGQRLASLTSYGSVQFWDPATGQEQAMVRGGTGLAFTPDGRSLVTTVTRGAGNWSVQAWLYDTATGNLRSSMGTGIIVGAPTTSRYEVEAENPIIDQALA